MDARLPERGAAAARLHGEKGCAGGELCPALSLPDLFRTPALSATREQIRALLDAVPPYFSQAAITPDRKTAVLAFGIRLQSLEGSARSSQDMRARLDPPDGRDARRVAGLPVLAADANHAMSDPLRRLLTALAGLVAVALALFAVYRSWERAWVPLVPIALATGWSALVLWLIGVPLNPMSAALSALVIAISTEFSVLLCARYREERDAGWRRRRAGAHLRVDRRRRPRLGRDRDRGLRRPDRLRHRDAARLRPGDRHRPHRLAARRARRPAGGPRRSPSGARAGAARRRRRRARAVAA